MLTQDIWLDTKSVGRIYFWSIDSLFRHLNNDIDDVIEGYLGLTARS